MARNRLYSPDYLKELVADPYSDVKLKKSVREILLQPFHLRDLSGAVAEILDGYLLRYDKPLNGILLGYSNAKLVGEKAACHLESSCVSVKVEAEFFVFRPHIGNTYKAVVHKIGLAHVGCLLYDHFNISLPIPKENLGLLKKILEKTQVTFTLEEMDLSGNLPFFRGQLKSVKSQPVESFMEKKKKQNVGLESQGGTSKGRNSFPEGTSKQEATVETVMRKSDLPEKSTKALGGDEKKKKKKKDKDTSTDQGSGQNIAQKSSKEGDLSFQSRPKQAPTTTKVKMKDDQPEDLKNELSEHKKKMKKSLSLKTLPKTLQKSDDDSDHTITPYQRPRKNANPRNVPALQGGSTPIEQFRGMMKSLLESPLKEILDNAESEDDESEVSAGPQALLATKSSQIVKTSKSPVGGSSFSKDRATPKKIPSTPSKVIPLNLNKKVSSSESDSEEDVDVQRRGSTATPSKAVPSSKKDDHLSSDSSSSSVRNSEVSKPKISDQITADKSKSGEKDSENSDSSVSRADSLPRVFQSSKLLPEGKGRPSNPSETQPPRPNPQKATSSKTQPPPSNTGLQKKPVSSSSEESSSEDDKPPLVENKSGYSRFEDGVFESTSKPTTPKATQNRSRDKSTPSKGVKSPLVKPQLSKSVVSSSDDSDSDDFTKPTTPKPPQNRSSDKSTLSKGVKSPLVNPQLSKSVVSSSDDSDDDNVPKVAISNQKRPLDLSHKESYSTEKVTTAVKSTHSKSQHPSSDKAKPALRKPHEVSSSGESDSDDGRKVDTVKPTHSKPEDSSSVDSDFVHVAKPATPKAAEKRSKSLSYDESRSKDRGKSSAAKPASSSSSENSDSETGRKAVTQSRHTSPEKGRRDEQRTLTKLSTSDPTVKALIKKSNSEESDSEDGDVVLLANQQSSQQPPTLKRSASHPKLKLGKAISDSVIHSDNKPFLNQTCNFDVFPLACSTPFSGGSNLGNKNPVFKNVQENYATQIHEASSPKIESASAKLKESNKHKKNAEPASELKAKTVQQRKPEIKTKEPGKQKSGSKSKEAKKPTSSLASAITDIKKTTSSEQDDTTGRNTPVSQDVDFSFEAFRLKLLTDFMNKKKLSEPKKTELDLGKKKPSNLPTLTKKLEKSSKVQKGVARSSNSKAKEKVPVSREDNALESKRTKSAEEIKATLSKVLSGLNFKDSESSKADKKKRDKTKFPSVHDVHGAANTASPSVPTQREKKPKKRKLSEHTPAPGELRVPGSSEGPPTKIFKKRKSYVEDTAPSDQFSVVDISELGEKTGGSLAPDLKRVKLKKKISKESSQRGENPSSNADSRLENKESVSHVEAPSEQRALTGEFLTQKKKKKKEKTKLMTATQPANLVPNFILTATDRESVEVKKKKKMSTEHQDDYTSMNVQSHTPAARKKSKKSKQNPQEEAEDLITHPKSKNMALESIAGFSEPQKSIVTLPLSSDKVESLKNQSSQKNIPKPKQSASKKENEALVSAQSLYPNKTVPAKPSKNPSLKSKKVRKSIGDNPDVNTKPVTEVDLAEGDEDCSELSDVVRRLIQQTHLKKLKDDQGTSRPSSKEKLMLYEDATSKESKKKSNKTSKRKHTDREDSELNLAENLELKVKKKKSKLGKDRAS